MDAIKTEILSIINEDKINFCFCGSMKPYKDCCKIWWEPTWINNQKLWKQIQKFFDIYQRSWKIIINPLREALWDNKCIEVWCTNKAIWSHIFSESKIKKEFWNHVGYFTQDYTGKIIPSKIWCNDAKTTLWCSEHDNKLFEFIDKEEFDKTRDQRKKEEYFFDRNYRTIGGFLKEITLKQRFLILWLIKKEQEAKDNFLKNYFEYNATCELFFRMMDMKNKDLVYCMPSKYWEIWINWLCLWVVFFPEIELKNWKKINNFESNIINPVIFNLYKSNGNLCYLFSCEPTHKDELREYMDSITKDKDLQKLIDFINWFLHEGVQLRIQKDTWNGNPILKLDFTYLSENKW